MLDLNQVAVFVQVVRDGSFAAAARRLAMPPTTVSRHVLQLEEHLGARMLQRSTRKLTLTDAGRSFFERSASQVEDLQQAARLLSDRVEEASGTVRVAAPADFFDFFLMDWVAEFMEAHPGVRLDFVLSDTMADLISEGIDVAFRGGELPDSSLVARRVAAARFALAASPAYFEARGVPPSPEALSEHECIRPSKPGRTVWHLDGPMGAADVEVTGRFSASTAQAQLKAAVAGLGIALLPSTMVLQSVRAGRLVEVLPGYGRSTGGFYVVYPSRRQIPRAVTAFVDMTVERLLGADLVVA